MSHYATEHAGALADIRAAGTDVVFTHSVTSVNQATDVETVVSTSTVSGSAIRLSGKVVYRTPTLVEDPTVNLLFAPDTYGDRPVLRSTASWEGATWTVVAVDPLSPDGTDILSRVGLA